MRVAQASLLRGLTETIHGRQQKSRGGVNYKQVNVLCSQMSLLKLEEAKVTVIADMESSEPKQAKTVFDFDKIQVILNKIDSKRNKTDKKIKKFVAKTSAKRLALAKGLKPKLRKNIGSIREDKQKSNKNTTTAKAAAVDIAGSSSTKNPVTTGLGLCRSKALTAIDLEAEKAKRIKRMVEAKNQYSTRSAGKKDRQKQEIKEVMKNKRSKARDRRTMGRRCGRSCSSLRMEEDTEADSSGSSSNIEILSDSDFSDIEMITTSKPQPKTDEERVELMMSWASDYLQTLHQGKAQSGRTQKPRATPYTTARRRPA